MERERRRARWRDYRTAGGSRPVKDFIDELTDEDAAEVIAAMKEIAKLGPSAARHLRRDIYEVRAAGQNRTYRVLFSSEGKHGHILLALVALTKKTQKDAARSYRLGRCSTARLEGAGKDAPQGGAGDIAAKI